MKDDGWGWHLSPLHLWYAKQGTNPAGERCRVPGLEGSVGWMVSTVIAVRGGRVSMSQRNLLEDGRSLVGFAVEVVARDGRPARGGAVGGECGG